MKGEKNEKNGTYIKLSVFVLAVILIFASFSGCIHTEQDIKNITVVQGIGIDYDSELEEYNLAVQIFDIAQSSGMGESESGNLTKVLNVKGDTVSSALNKITLEIGKSMVFSHNKVIVLSEEAVNSGINSVMDFFLREYRNRSNVSVVIASDCTAAEIIEADQGDVSFPARELETLLESGRINGYTTDITISDLAEMEEDDCSATIIPTVKLRTENGSQYTTLSGMGIVKDEKLVGKLTLDEARGVLFVNDEIEGGTFNVKDKNLGLSTLKIVKSKTRIDIALNENADKKENRNMHFTVEVKCVADVIEISEKTGKTISEDDSNRLEKSAEERLESIIESALVACLNEYNSDVFGLTRRVWIFYPEFYRENLKLFKTNPDCENVDVKVKVDIRRTGQGGV